ncbi:short chain dehydrogenase [Saccharothrix australiensis]|uniref:NADP-dependent 3-hydroxy acid dehydrogenase YdfG n=1 Tax=Saccharothrix australiensis TaxID=2072 RepID=A0A495W1S0_9PSEU|nr:short chain dehydrogenase [Saccharothrix australiensis]RKT55419.1 NADP-dependent 3-hydroxy acid dehydrogenase YdfG [Saccharothrix australiensis]
MKIMLIGASGTLGSAVHRTLADRGHDVLTVGRGAGALRADVSDPAGVAALYDAAGPLDAVACAAGDVPFKPLSALTADDFHAGLRGKVLSQVELVRQGVSRIAERGSFTLVTGVLAREPIVAGSVASLANGAIEAFVRAAAIEIAPQRVNAVSPTIVTESVPDYGDFFRGMPSVDLADVARAYVRSIEGAQTGQVFIP